MEKLRTRDTYFDKLKDLLIILVVIGHVLQRECDANIVYRLAHDLIYCFHMPMFVLLSGFFSRNTERAGERAFEKLFVPFIILNVVAGVLIEKKLCIDPLQPYYGYWYLICLFIWRLLAKDIKRIGKKAIPISFGIALIAGLLPGNSAGGGGSLHCSRCLCWDLTSPTI